MPPKKRTLPIDRYREVNLLDSFSLAS